MSGKKYEQKLDLLDRFERISSEVPMEDDEVEEILTAANIDAEAAYGDLLRRIEASDANMRAREFELLAEKRQEELRKIQDRDEPRPRQLLLKLVEKFHTLGLQPQAMYKNLEEVSDEDLESLVSELEMLVDDEEA